MVPADLVLLNGNVITMNSKMPSAQAIAVTGDKISFVGSDQEVKQHIGEKTQVMSLNGKTVMPGFIDTHIHVVDYGKMLTWMDLERVSSISALQAQLTTRIKQVGVGKWVLGRALDPEKFLERRLPTCQELDEVSPDNPVVFYCKSGQVCVVNSKTLKVADIEHKNDVGIERFSGGLTGVLRDQATNFVWQVIPEHSVQELYKATQLALEKIVQFGITSIHWIVLSEAELFIIQKLVETDSLPLRVYLIVPTNLLDLALQRLKPLEGQQFKFGGSIIFVDGHLASRTAALLEPYSDRPMTQGKMLHRRGELLVLANRIQNAGLQLVMHAVGDKAIQEAINTIRQVNRNSAVAHPRLEQAAVLNHQAMLDIEEADVSVSIQPCVVASEFSVWLAKERLGERVDYLFPVKKLLDCGVLVSAGSDCPMEPLNPLCGIEAAVKREGAQGVSVFEALQMYTVFAARAASEENKGSIEVGKLADLIALSNNPMTVVVDEIVKVSVCFRVIGGRVCCSKN